jgi:hypothetical protein
MLKKRLLSRSRDPDMTLPDERYRAVVETQKFLAEILATPRVPKEIKAQARSLLRHYPNAYDMNQAVERCPEVFQKRMEDLHRFIAQGVRATANNEAAELTSLQGYKNM